VGESHLQVVMWALAVEPIGKKSTPSQTIVGQMLANLPHQAAFVRSVETVGVIYTDDMPARLEGTALVSRISTILEQARKKYFHPRTEVERLFVQPSKDTIIDNLQPQTRWEEI
jgi:hypothetical protein